MSFSSQLTIGSLQSLSRPDWFLRFMVILLYSDLHLLALYKISLFKFTPTEWLKIFQTKDILFFLFCITFFLSLGFGLLRSIMVWLWKYVKGMKDKKNYIDEYCLYKKATEDKNDFDLKLYREHITQKIKSRAIKDLCFGFIILCFIDIIVSKNDTLVLSFWKSFLNLDLYLILLISIPVILFVIGAVSIGFDFSTYEEDHILYPQKPKKD